MFSKSAETGISDIDKYCPATVGVSKFDKSEIRAIAKNIKYDL